MERYKRGIRNYGENKDKVEFKVKFVRQCIVCAIVFVTVFVISLLNTNTASLVTKRIEDTISYTVDYKGAVTDIVYKIKNILKGELQWKNDALK